MASNYHINGGAVTDKDFSFAKPVNNINIFVGSGVTFTISFDGGENFLTIAPGSISMPVGPVKNLVITSDGAWSLLGVQG